MRETKGHGYYRKSKAYGLVCGIALAGAFAFNGGNVSADEVTAPAQSQTVVTTLTESTNNQAQAVTSEALNTAVSTAKEAGVTVNTTGAVSHTDVPSAQSDLASQIQTVKDATAKAEANTQAIKDATAQNAQIDAQNQAEATRVAEVNKAGQLAVDQKNAQAKALVDKQNADAQAQADATNAQLKADYEAKLAEIKTVEDYNKAVAERNALAKQQADATNAQLKADYQTKLDAYNKALADKINLIANDVAFEGYGKSEDLNAYGIVTSDTITIDGAGNFILKEPMSDPTGVIGYITTKGKLNYSSVYDPTLNKANITIDSITLDTWQLDLTRPSISGNTNAFAEYIGLDGTSLFKQAYTGLTSMSPITIGKTSQIGKTFTVASGETTPEFMFLKTNPFWEFFAPSSLYAKLSYNTNALPPKPQEPTLVTVTPEPLKPVPQTPPTPVYVTPTLKTFAPEVYTPIKPTVKPHVVVPEKLNVTVSVHPVMVPVANPSKDVIDEAGKSINGLSLLPNSDLNYVAKQDFSQYKGMSASQDKIAKNFIFIDDYKDEALDGKSMVVNSIKAKNGDDVSHLLEMHHVLSKDGLDVKLQAILAESGLSPVGEFYMWVAKDPTSFYKAYVQKGLDITYNLSFKVHQTFTESEIVNGVAQIDFGNGYLGNLVVNDLPKPEVHKDVIDEAGKSINNGTVKLGDEVTYKLEGWVVPTGRSYDLFEYKFVDQLQNTHDLYLKDSVVAKVDITLSDGTVVKKGTDLAEYTETIYNKETGRYELAFKKEFLEKVTRSSEFGADAFIVVKRIKAGDVYNDYTLYVNGNPVKSNRVVTHTPEDPKPVTPQKATPKTPALPHTGEASVAPLTAIGAIILSVLGLVGFKKRKEN